MRHPGTYPIVAAALAALLGACGADEPVLDVSSDPLTVSSIYSDALAPGWTDWSWATRSLANTSPVWSGTRSISVSYGPWQGLYFHSSTGVSTVGLTHLVFEVNGGATSGPVLAAYATVAGVQKPMVKFASYCDGGSIPAYAWTRCRIPLSALGAAGARLDGIVLKEYAGRTLPRLYLDAIRLTGPSTAVSVSVSPASVSLAAGGTQQLTATVSGTTNLGVTWTVLEGAAGGSIDSTGLYTAPSTAGTYHPAATSVADPTRSGTAAVTVVTSSPPPPPPPDGTTDVIAADRRTRWNPGITSDGQLGLPLGADGVPQRTTICATVSPGGDIQGAVDACPAGQVVQLAAGSFTVSTTITLTNGVVLRGAGSQGAPGGTTIVRTGGGSVLAIGSDQDSTCYGGTGYPLAADGAKDATTLAVGSAAASFRVGDLALVDAVDDATIQQGDCSYFKRVSGRSASQRVEVTAVDTAGGILTLGSPLHWKFPAASPYLGQITRVTRATTRWAGIERLRIQGGTNPSYDGAMAGGIDVSNAAYCWVKDVQTDGTIGGMHVALTGAYRCVVRDSVFHHSASYGFGTDCYGIVLRCGSAENLVENNVVRFMNKPVLFSASGGGNVVAYNYVDNSWSSPASWQEVNVDSHCAFPHMELVEGNWAPHMGATRTHGNAGYLTFFRNYASSRFASPAVVGSTASQSGNVTALQFDGGDVGMNVLGNVLGTAGWSTTYDAHDSGSFAIYQIGAGGGGAADVAFTSLFRHANFDTVSNAVVWDPATTSRTLPSSLYLGARPGWWPDAVPWPWAGPDLSPMVGALPAKQRSDAMGL